MNEDITKTLKITLSNQVIVDLTITGTKSLVESIGISEYKIKDELTEFILNGFKIKSQQFFRDEKGKFVKLDEILHPK